MLTWKRHRGKGMRWWGNFSVPVMPMGRMGACDLMARYAAPAIPLINLLSGLRCPSGKMTNASSLASSARPVRSALTPKERSTGWTLIELKSHPFGLGTNSSCFPRKDTGRGMAAATEGGSL